MPIRRCRWSTRDWRTEAAKIGADAVIQVRYGTVGMSWMVSWGSLDGKGRAIAYDKPGKAAALAALLVATWAVRAIRRRFRRISVTSPPGQ